MIFFKEKSISGITDSRRGDVVSNGSMLKNVIKATDAVKVAIVVFLGAQSDG